MENKSGQQKIDIYCIVRDVLRDIWVAVVIGIAAAFLAYVGASLLYQPTYTSQTTFVVSVKGNTNGAYENMAKAQRLAEVFQSVLDSQVLKKRVSEELGYDGFPGIVTSSLVPETNLLTVSVTSSSPGTSFELLRKMLECYPEVGEKVLGEVVMEVFEEPGYPVVPNESFNGNQLMKKAFFAGAFLMLALLAFLSYMKDTVKNEADITAKLDTTTVAVLPHERRYKSLKDLLKKKKKNLFVTEPTTSFGYVETMKKVRTKLMYHLKRNNAKVVLVTSSKPGEGKTTFAINLAQVFAQQSRKVLLIEGNLKESVLAKRLQLDGAGLPDWGQYFEKGHNLDEAVFESEDWRFHVMLNQTKVARSTEVLASVKMQRFLERMRRKYDVIIIDAPHTWRRSDTEVLARISDLSLLVVKQNEAPVRLINDSIDMLNQYGRGLLGCIFNDVLSSVEILSSGYGYGYGYGYGKYGRYGQYGTYYNSINKESENE